MEIEPLGDESDWRHVKHTVRHVHSHPQELIENNIDIAHLSTLHGLRNAQLVELPIFDGPRMHVDYTYTQPTPWTSGVDITMRLRMDGSASLSTRSTYSVSQCGSSAWRLRSVNATRSSICLSAYANGAEAQWAKHSGVASKKCSDCP